MLNFWFVTAFRWWPISFFVVFQFGPERCARVCSLTSHHQCRCGMQIRWKPKKWFLTWLQRDCSWLNCEPCDCCLDLMGWNPPSLHQGEIRRPPSRQGWAHFLVRCASSGNCAFFFAKLCFACGDGEEPSWPGRSGTVDPAISLPPRQGCKQHSSPGIYDPTNGACTKVQQQLRNSSPLRLTGHFQLANKMSRLKQSLHYLCVGLVMPLMILIPLITGNDKSHLCLAFSPLAPLRGDID